MRILSRSSVMSLLVLLICIEYASVGFAQSDSVKGSYAAEELAESPRISRDNTSTVDPNREAIEIYRDAIEASRSQSHWTLAFASLFMTLLSILIVVFGYIKPEKDRNQFEKEMTQKFADLEQANNRLLQELGAAKFSAENLAFSFTNLLFGNMLMEKAGISEEASSLPGGMDPLPYFANALSLLTQTIVQYGRLEIAYAFALHGIHSCLLAGQRLTEADRGLVENALRFLETDQIWRNNNRVSGLVKQVRERIPIVAYPG